MVATTDTLNALLQRVLAGEISPDEATALITRKPGRKANFRKTANGTVWCGLPYKATKGQSASVCLPKQGWEMLIAMFKDGSLEATIKDWDSIPLSAAAAE